MNESDNFYLMRKLCDEVLDLDCVFSRSVFEYFIDVLVFC